MIFVFVFKDCGNKRDNCYDMVAMDYCRLMSTFMEENCREACGLCSNVQTTPDVTPEPVSTSKDTKNVTTSTMSVKTKPETTVVTTEKKTELSSQPNPEPTSEYRISTVSNTVKQGPTSKSVIATEGTSFSLPIISTEVSITLYVFEISNTAFQKQRQT